MTKLAALRALLAQPRDHVHQGRIGKRVIFEKSDGRERLSYTVRILRTVLRRTA